MGLGYGLVTAGAQLGLQAVIIKPKRKIGDFEAQVTISERHTDELEVVDHPVEFGAKISDHAFMRPPEVVIDCAWSDSPRASGLPGGLLSAVTGTLAGLGPAGVARAALITGNTPDQVKDVYERLRAVQKEAILLDVVTGKRSYDDMLIRSLIVETDKDHEHVLRVTVTLRQVLIAYVRVVSISAPKENQADPEATMPPTDKGAKQLSTDVRTFSVPDGMETLENRILLPGSNVPI